METKKNNNSNRRSFEFHRSTAAASSMGKYVEAPVQLAHSFSLCWDGSFHMVRARYREKGDRAGTNAQKLKRKKSEKKRRKEKRLSVVQQHVTLSLTLSILVDGC